MSLKMHALCWGCAIPFGMWSVLMAKTGIKNPTLVALILFTGSLIPFIPTIIREGLPANLQATWPLWVALAFAYGVAIFHGGGQSNYLYIVTHNGQGDISLAKANVYIFFLMLNVVFTANYVLLDEKLTGKKLFALALGNAAIWLYTR